MKRKTTPLGEAIKALRVALGGTQQQFAERFAVANNTIVHRWEIGEMVPRASILVRLFLLASEALPSVGAAILAPLAASTGLPMFGLALAALIAAEDIDGDTRIDPRTLSRLAKRASEILQAGK